MDESTREYFDAKFDRVHERMDGIIEGQHKTAERVAKIEAKVSNGVVKEATCHAMRDGLNAQVRVLNDGLHGQVASIAEDVASVKRRAWGIIAGIIVTLVSAGVVALVSLH